MDFFEKIWIRALFSLFIGALIQVSLEAKEFVNPDGIDLTLLYATIFFIALTIAVRVARKYENQHNQDSESENDSSDLKL